MISFYNLLAIHTFFPANLFAENRICNFKMLQQNFKPSYLWFQASRIIKLPIKILKKSINRVSTFHLRTIVLVLFLQFRQKSCV